VAAFTDPSLFRYRLHSAQALIEFSLIVPVMLLMTVGMISLGRGFVYGVAVQEGTRQAARLAASSNVNTTVTLATSDILGRVVAGSNPALVGCLAQVGAQTCNGGAWSITLSVLGTSGASYTTLEAARTANDLTGSQVTVTVTGAVAVLPGVDTGIFGLKLPQVGVQGQSSMVVL